jgi:hypothetical protein
MKMKTYVLTVSRKFPKGHQCAGDETGFIDAITNGLHSIGVDRKIHTMRHNYDLWEKRFKQINEGKAQLSIRYWSEKPYRSKQVILFTLDRSHGIGLQKLKMGLIGWHIDNVITCHTFEEFAKNDGLSKGDWYDWFRESIERGSKSEPLAIIHFTKFRY